MTYEKLRELCRKFCKPWMTKENCELYKKGEYVWLEPNISKTGEMPDDIKANNG